MLFAFIFSLFACRNDCQDLCYDLSDFAEECGYEFTNEMMDECIDNQGDKNRDEKNNCDEAKPLLEEEWTCEDVAIYFDT